MDENDAGEDTTTGSELSLRLASYQKEMNQLTAEYPELMLNKMHERNELVELLKTEQDPEKAEALWKQYDHAGVTFSQWITDYQNRIADLAEKIRETNDLLWKSRERPKL
jgi:hypothetical protein